MTQNTESRAEPVHPPQIGGCWGTSESVAGWEWGRLVRTPPL